VPKSISYAACKEDEYFPVMMAVGRIIESTTGMAIDLLFAQAATSSGVMVPRLPQRMFEEAPERPGK
jgi:hypothetical protein